MAFVTMNVLVVPEERREEFERRFAARAAQVENQEGFEAFELMRPVEGTDRYVVYTRWRDREDFQRWLESPAFMAGHRPQGEGGPMATASEIWMMDVIQSEYATKQEA